MIKAVKKLKLWCRKKKKRKTHPPLPPPPYDPPPPPPPPPQHQCHCCCSYTASSSPSTAQPSAPPLPPWMNYTEHNHEILLAPDLRCPAPELAYHPLPVPSKQESSAPALKLNPTSSYQQYMVPDPVHVYGIPVTQAPTAARERFAGFFGCVVDYLFRFFPCFRIREVAK